LAEYNSYVVLDKWKKAVKTGAVHATHIRFLKRNVNHLFPLKYFVRLHGEAFYLHMNLFYPQAWAFVYFLKNSNTAPTHVYDKLMVGSRKGLGAKECVNVAFHGVDLTELDKTFREFIVNFED